MTPSVRLDSFAKRLRAQAFIHALADEVGCGHSGQELGRWWKQNYEKLPTRKVNRKWSKYFLGSLPQRNFRELLVGMFPSLQLILDNNIWWALGGRQNTNEYWDEYAFSVRVCGEPIGFIEGDSTKAIFDYPSWDRIWVMVILLRTRSFDFSLHRLWLSRNFSSVFFLACSQPPLNHVRWDLYQAITALIDKGEFGEQFLERWPYNDASFWQRVSHFNDIVDMVRFNRWGRERGEIQLLIWMLLGKKGIFEGVPSREDGRPAVRFPDSARKAWSRLNNRYAEVKISLDVYG